MKWQHTQTHTYSLSHSLTVFPSPSTSLNASLSIDEKIIINCFNLHIKRVRYTDTRTHTYTRTH